MQTMIDLECGFCKKKFQKRATEHKRCLARGLKSSFCSRKCCNSRDFYKNNLDAYNKLHGRYDISQHANNLRDEYSPFRPHLKFIKLRCKKSPKNLICDITLTDLKVIWENQKGICPYTGIKLINFNASPHKSYHICKSPYRASVDRIDSSKGYTKDNIQFVSLIAQYAKNDWDEIELIEFCKKVAYYRK